MYRLAPHVDLAFLRQLPLLQVCIGLNEAILNFDGDTRITLLTDYSIATNGVAVRYGIGVAGASSLCQLLGETVEEAYPTPSGGLFLQFSSAKSLELFDTSDRYESFWITRPGSQIIV